MTTYNNTAATVYFSEGTGGKKPVYTSFELKGRGIRFSNSNAIFQHKGEIMKNMNCYWVTEKAFEALKAEYATEWVYKG